MPKPNLSKEMMLLEGEILETLIAGLHEWRSDLSYPESHSDMQACIRGLLSMFEVKRRPLAIKLPIECYVCDGLGVFRQDETYSKTCTKCHGRRTL